MRHFELVAGTSAKFWDIEVQDTSVTVSYGRIGTVGRTTTKDFDSVSEAQDHAAKLIASKVKKGYIEDEAPQASSASAPASVAASAAPALPTQPAPASLATSQPPQAAEQDQAERDQEDRFEFPSALAKQIPPDRDQYRPARAARINPKHVDSSATGLRRFQVPLEEEIAASPDPEISGADANSPLGLASRIVSLRQVMSYSDWEQFFAVEYLLSEHSPAFVARVVTETASLDWSRGRQSNLQKFYGYSQPEGLVRGDPREGRI